MSSLVPLEDAEIQPYTLKVTNALLQMGLVHGVQPESMVEFLAAQVQNMLACPPNCKQFGPESRVWILRGFYPGTPLFFKLTVSSKVRHGRYFAKAQIPIVKNHFRRELVSTFDGRLLNEHMTNAMENAVFGAKHKITPLFEGKMRRPKCMSPKGMPLLRYKSPTKKRKA